MDDQSEIITVAISEPETRDENKSPTTSGSSSEAFAEDRSVRPKRNRKQRRHPRTKRKRIWKPYNEMSWDEQRVQDDWESRRAFAKRERLSAEGHPIAPYNTTQFLMDDCKVNADGSPRRTSEVNNKRNVVVKQSDLDKDNQNNLRKMVTRITESDSSKNLLELEESNAAVEDFSISSGKSIVDQVQFRLAADSPLLTESGTCVDSELGAEIQRYIMNDFTDMYAGIHAEQLQSMTKPDLVHECLKLERRVDLLEKRAKDCRKKHKYDTKGRADLHTRTDAHLLEKINLLQAQNVQLMKENAALENQKKVHNSTSSMPASTDGASVDTE